MAVAMPATPQGKKSLQLQRLCGAKPAFLPDKRLPASRDQQKLDQFERYGRDKYHEAKEDLPEVGGEYLYLRRKLRPQVCWEEFRDGYWDWRSDCTTQKCPAESVISRIPKKKLDHDPSDKDSTQERLPVEVIWGIVARTQRAFYVAVIYVAIAASPLVPATWFFVKWLSPPDEGMDEYQLANHRDNLSNAFVPLGIVIALLLATITCVISKFE